MRALRTLIVLAALLAFAGAATAQNAPCPECDPDGEPVENSYHSIDVGVIEENTSEVLADTDTSYAHPDDEKGFWLWFSLCLSAFVDQIEEALGVQTDVDANAQVYADSEGVDLDASVTGVQHVCAELGVNEACDWNFDQSELGDLDGTTYEAVADVEAATGVDVFVPALVPETEDSDTDVCLQADLVVVPDC